MKMKKLTAVLLCALFLISMLPTVTAAGVNGYYNVDYLEAEAAAAYGEEGLGAVYTPQATTWKLWSPTANTYSSGSTPPARMKRKGRQGLVPTAWS